MVAFLKYVLSRYLWKPCGPGVLWSVGLAELGAGQEEAGAEQGKTLGGFSAVTQTVAAKLTKHNMRTSCCLVSLSQVLVATLAAAAATLIQIR